MRAFPTPRPLVSSAAWRTYREHTDLPVYQASFAAALELHALTMSPPPLERDTVVQARRCATSICANTAEGWAKRRSPRSLGATFNVALGEVGEVQFWLQYTGALKLIPEDRAEQLAARYREVRAQLIYMMENAARWRPPRTGHPPEG